MEQFDLSERRACKLVELDSSTYRYEPRADHNALRTRQHTPSDLQNPGHHPFGSAPSRQLPYEALSVVQKFDLGVTAIGGVVGTGSGRITAYTEVMHLIAASNQGDGI
jgi:hypothetical protein